MEEDEESITMTAAATQTEPMSDDEMMATSLQTYGMIKSKLITRYGAAMVHAMPGEETTGVTMNWFPKRGGRQAKLSVSITDIGAVRIEFTLNTVEGISWKAPTEDNRTDLQLNDGTFVRLKNNLELPALRGNIMPDIVYSSRMTTPQFAMEIVDTVLMA